MDATFNAPRVTLAVLCRTVAAADRAYDALRQAGVASENLNVLAHGVEVDRRLVRDREINANQKASVAEPAAASGLASHLSRKGRFLVENCWAEGPVFRRAAKRAGVKAMTILECLEGAGLETRTAASVESFLRGNKGVWIGVTGPVPAQPTLDESLAALKDTQVLRIS
ncbi:MAG TPA: hypothetical protein VMT52_14995 [Planctomycetota bacterium]|nr:hypothetical protein [Planctomycetota bacterium]